ncbi:MAG TPA: 1-acyl-sn-glycerol-3-phosphate acyltransferase [Pyrinomonadaceae bacterium]|nr:1-acyl-sn-glycerol-3-phosphate acyltransferase [Pyrinomonadaceae bacterium]
MARVIVIDDRPGVAELVVKGLNESFLVEFCQRAPPQEDGFGGHLSGGHGAFLEEQAIDAVVYSPPLRARRIDLEDAESLCRQCAGARVERFVLLSSAMVYGASPHNQGLIPETRPVLSDECNQFAKDWRRLEALAISYFGQASRTSAQLTILRLAAMPVPGGDDYFSEFFGGRIAVTLPGHDPTMQLLSPQDLATAVRCVFEGSKSGVYNVAPDGVVTLRAALRLAGVRRVPISRLLQRGVRAVLKRIDLATGIQQLDYVRYSWTISDQKIRSELSFRPQHSSAKALAEFRAANNPAASHETEIDLPSEFDDFGMDKHYIAAFGRTLFKFLHDYYWRVEVKGLDHVPRRGRAVLVGLHRGFMPWDGVMALHLLVQKLSRYPRFLIHPGLIKFPFLFNYMTKLGGIIACQENAAYVLERDELLGLFPEGIRGAFSLYRDAYKLGKFGRDEYVKLALRHRAPIIPFVTVGSAEIFPILKKLDWAWWKRHTEWPALPITPTFPFLPPVPLPAKWHTQFLEPIHIEQRYPPEAASDPSTVRAISLEVRNNMEDAIGEMLRRRKSVFYGSIFNGQTSEKLSYEEPIAYKEKLS